MFLEILQTCVLRSATLLKKILWHRCFPVNFAKFPRTPFLQNTSLRLLLAVKNFSNFQLIIVNNFRSNFIGGYRFFVCLKAFQKSLLLLVICSAIFFLYFQIVFYTIFVNLHHGTCVSVTYSYTFLFLESVYTWNFIPGWSSSWVEIILVCDEMSLTVYTFLPKWNFITEWTHPGMKDRDEISSRDEKKKKRRVNTSSRDEILKWACFFNFWRMYSSMFSKFNMFEHNESLNIMKHKPSL